MEKLLTDVMNDIITLILKKCEKTSAPHFFQIPKILAQFCKANSKIMSSCLPYSLLLNDKPDFRGTKIPRKSLRRSHIFIRQIILRPCVWIRSFQSCCCLNEISKEVSTVQRNFSSYTVFHPDIWVLNNVEFSKPWQILATIWPWDESRQAFGSHPDPLASIWREYL